MSIYRELDPMAELRTQFAIKDDRKRITMVNIPNIAYPGQHIDIEIPHGSTDHIIVPDAVKIMFNLDIELTDKTCRIANSVVRALVKKKVFMLGSKDIDTNIDTNSTQVFMTRTSVFT